MGIKRVVDVEFWKDNDVMEKYSFEDRAFFLYLLTNPSCKQCGIYHLPVRMIAFEFGQSQESVKAVIERFEQRFKNIIYNYDTQEIAILNFLKHSIIKGGKPVEDCIRKELEQVKDKSLIAKVYNHMYPYMLNHMEKHERSMYYGINEVFKEFVSEEDKEKEIQKENVNDNDKQNDNDNDNERYVPRIVQRIVNDYETEFIDVWNLYPRKQGKANALKAFIKARKSGVSLNQILTGLNNYINYLHVEKVKPEYIKHGSTWFNQKCWEDDYTVKKQLTTRDVAESASFSKFRN